MLGFRAVADPTLDDILSHVSRSFYLSLAVLPKSVRAQVSVAYLVARAADTIADSRVIEPARRQQLLSSLRAGVEDPEKALSLGADVERELVSQEGGCTPSEQALLIRLSECLQKLSAMESGDRVRAQKVLSTLITGMDRDLARFPAPKRGQDWAGPPVALSTLAELEEHAYFAAGCVGEYWTTMTASHVEGLSRLQRPDFVARGVRLGKALQYVNVIRDTPRDLVEGRCYLPTELLAPRGLVAADLRDPITRKRARPVLAELGRICLRHVDAAFPYVMAIPRTEPRLRLAALWPLWIGLSTLEALGACEDPLDPAAPVKIARSQVYRIMAESLVVVTSDTLLSRAHQRRRKAADS